MDDLLVLLLIAVSMGVYLLHKAKERHRKYLQESLTALPAGKFGTYQPPLPNRGDEPEVKYIQSDAINLALWRIAEYTVRDFVDFWYFKNVSKDPEFPNDVRDMLDFMFSRLAEGVQRVDWTYFVAQRVLNTLRDLLRILRITETQLLQSNPEFATADDGTRTRLLQDAILDGYKLHVAATCTPTEQLDYLRKISGALGSKLLRPRDYNSDIMRSLLREVFACNVLGPTMGFVSPYWINVGIVTIMQKMAMAAEEKTDVRDGQDETDLPAEVTQATPSSMAREGPLCVSSPRVDTIPTPSSTVSSVLSPVASPSGTPMTATTTVPTLSSGGDAISEKMQVWQAERTRRIRRAKLTEKVPVAILESQKLTMRLKHKEKQKEHLKTLEHGQLRHILEQHNGSKPNEVKDESVVAASHEGSTSVEPVSTAEDSVMASPSPAVSLTGEHVMEHSETMSTTEHTTPLPFSASSTSVASSSGDMSSPRVPSTGSVPGSMERSTGKSRYSAAALEFLQTTNTQAANDWEVKIVRPVTKFDPRPYIEYRMKVRNGNYSWDVYKRYSQFVDLHDKLKLKIRNFDAILPKKQMFGNLSQKFVNSRKEELQNYLDRLMWNRNVVHSEEFRLFLMPAIDAALVPNALVNEIDHHLSEKPDIQRAITSFKSEDFMSAANVHTMRRKRALTTTGAGRSASVLEAKDDKPHTLRNIFQKLKPKMLLTKKNKPLKSSAQTLHAATDDTVEYEQQDTFSHPPSSSSSRAGLHVRRQRKPGPLSDRSLSASVPVNGGILTDGLLSDSEVDALTSASDRDLIRSATHEDSGFESGEESVRSSRPQFRRSHTTGVDRAGTDPDTDNEKDSHGKGYSRSLATTPIDQGAQRRIRSRGARVRPSSSRRTHSKSRYSHKTADNDADYDDDDDHDRTRQAQQPPPSSVQHSPSPLSTLLVNRQETAVTANATTVMNDAPPSPNVNMLSSSAPKDRPSPNLPATMRSATAPLDISLDQDTTQLPSTVTQPTTNNESVSSAVEGSSNAPLSLRDSLPRQTRPTRSSSARSDESKHQDKNGGHRRRRSDASVHSDHSLDSRQSESRGRSRSRSSSRSRSRSNSRSRSRSNSRSSRTSSGSDSSNNHRRRRRSVSPKNAEKGRRSGSDSRSSSGSGNRKPRRGSADRSSGSDRDRRRRSRSADSDTSDSQHSHHQSRRRRSGSDDSDLDDPEHAADEEKSHAEIKVDVADSESRRGPHISSKKESDPEKAKRMRRASLKFWQDNTIVTQPLYNLVDEIFALNERGFLRGKITSLAKVVIEFLLDGFVKKWFQGQVEAHTNEEAVVMWIEWITSLVWPGGELFKAGEAPTPDLMDYYRDEAKARMLQSVPGSLQTLLGKTPTKKGIARLFQFCQVEPLVLHFVYTTLDALVQELFPDLKPLLQSDYERFAMP